MDKIILFKNNFIKKIKLLFSNNIFLTIILFLISALILSFFYRSRVYYFSNQHTKFIHGLAHAGYGYLKNDWLVKTIDPLPIFSFIIYFTYRFLNQYFFYFYYIILLGFFIYIIPNLSVNVFNRNIEQKDKRLIKFIIFTLLIVFFSTLFRVKIWHILYFDRLFPKVKFLEWFFTIGVADQYIFGNFFQPCMFGILFFISIYLFLKNKPFLAVLISVFVASVHTVYIFSAGVLTLSYMIVICKDEKDIKKALMVGAFAFLLILPTIIYNYIYLGPTSKELSKEALDILINMRIPKHSLPEKWLEDSVYVKMALIIISIFITRKTKIFIIILTSFLFATILTIIQLFVNNDIIAFVAPWRISSYLVPLSSSIITGFIVIKFYEILKKYLTKYYIIVFIVFFFMLLLTIGYEEKRRPLNLKKYYSFYEYKNKKTMLMMKFVEKNKRPNDVYLIPRNLSDFRLNTGAPVFVTWKSHPYKDYEVIEWFKRIKITDTIYSINKTIEEKNELLKILYLNNSITHVILTKNEFNIKFDSLEELYKDNNYGVYKINVTKNN